MNDEPIYPIIIVCPDYNDEPLCIVSDTEREAEKYARKVERALDKVGIWHYRSDNMIHMAYGELIHR